MAEGETGETEGGVVLRETQIITHVRLLHFSPDPVVLNWSSDPGNFVKYNTSNLISPHTRAQSPFPYEPPIRSTP